MFARSLTFYALCHPPLWALFPPGLTLSYYGNALVKPCVVVCNRSQATLPFQLEGHDSVHSTASAFVGSCNSVCILVSRLVEYFKVFVPFPGKEHALTFFDRCF